MDNLDVKLAEIGRRIREMREIMELSQEHMAKVTQVSLEEYQASEAGMRDFSFTFLLACAGEFGMDMVELVTGEPPRLNYYTVVRKGKGLPIKRREDLNYEHLAYKLKNKRAEPFLVTAPYDADLQDKPIHLSAHSGQEFDYILKGRLKVQIATHTEIIGPGDSIYYDSSFGHGMIAIDGEECVFIAVVIKDPDSAEPQKSEEK